MPFPPKLISKFLPDLELILVEEGQVTLGEDETKKPLSIAPFYMAKYPVTQDLYKALMAGENPSHFKGGNRPVETVSWNDTYKFLKELNNHTAILKELQEQLPDKENTKISFRLPSEAEWEYAAKGGKYSEGYDYCGSDRIKQVAWCDDNSGGETKPVGLLDGNELGLHDMSGNVWEWCADDYHRLNSSDSKNRPEDGSAWIDKPDRASSRVLRGGSYFYYPILCRPSFRDPSAPGRALDFFGFRLVFGFLVQSVGD